MRRIDGDTVSSTPYGHAKLRSFSMPGRLARPRAASALVDGIDPRHALGLLHRLRRETGVHRLAGAGIDLVVRPVGREVSKIARSALGGHLEPLAPAHAGPAADDIDH